MKSETTPYHILKNFSILSFGTFFGKISGLLLKVIVAKFLGPEILGLYVLLNLIISYYSYAFLGVSYTLPRVIPKMQAVNDLDKINQTRSIINYFFCIVSFVLTLLFMIYISFFHQKDISSFSKINLILVFLTAFFYQFTTLITKHIKSIGAFSKLYINESFIKILSPLVASALIIKFGLNGYLFSNLIFAIFNFLNFCYYSYSKKLSLFTFNYFNVKKLIDHIKLGFAMLISQKSFSSQGILYTLLFTILGFNFSLKTVGEIGFIVSFFNLLVPIFKSYLMPAERIIYSINQSNELPFKNLFDLTFLNTTVIGSMTLFLGIVLKYIIPIYFEEFNGSIQYFSLIALLFITINSLHLIHYYLNGFNIYLKRNIAAITSIIVFILVSQMMLFKTNPIFLFLLYIVVVFIYKIFAHFLAISIFNENYTVLKIISFELLAGLFVWLLCLFLFKDLLSTIVEIGLIIAFIFFLHLITFRTPNETFKGLYEFFV